jgi:hypothetical protein
VVYRIEGLPPEPFQPLFALADTELEARGARRVVADSKPGYPCRVTLEDAEPGERLILLNHVSHDVSNPYRAAHAIYVRESARRAAEFVDRLPPVFDGRVLSLRGFDRHGMLRDAALAIPGEAEAAIGRLFARREIGTIHAHNAAYGCFAARIERN